jgi:hypothetical protein
MDARGGESATSWNPSQILDELQVLDEIATVLEHTKSGKLVPGSEDFRGVPSHADQRARLPEGSREHVADCGELERVPAHSRALAGPELHHAQRAHDGFHSRSKDYRHYSFGRLDINGCALADELFRAYLKQVLVDGVFHADPHPGNVFLTDDQKIALLDLGMIGRTTPELQESLVKILIAISEGKGDTAAQIAVDISQPTEEFNETEFRRSISTFIRGAAKHRLKETGCRQSGPGLDSVRPA